MARSGGLYALVANSRWRQQRLQILGYHGVSLRDEHQWSNLYISPDHLRHRLQLIHRGGYRVLPLDTALRGLREGTLPQKSVAVTFDDGTYDFHARAYPLLQEFGVHATLYLTTYYCGYQAPVFDPMISYLLYKGQGRSLDLQGLTSDGGRLVIPSGTAAARSYAHRAILNFAALNRLSAQEKDALARLLATRVGVDYDELRAARLLHLMNADEVRSLRPDIVAVELHTHRHRVPRDEALFKRELTDNDSLIRAYRLGAPRPRHFCYPSGDYDPAFFPWLTSMGIASATTCDPQIAARDSNPLILPRFIDSMEATVQEFEGWLSGLAAFIPQRRGIGRTA